MEMTKKEEKKSEWYWEIGDKKTNKPTEVIAWLIVEKAKLEEENKKLRAYVDNLDSENDNQAIEIEELKKENKKLKEELRKYKKQYQQKSD